MTSLEIISFNRLKTFSSIEAINESLFVSQDTAFNAFMLLTNLLIESLMIIESFSTET
jgi:hypothetical protein